MNYLGQFYPYGADHPDVLASYSLKSTNDIGNATATDMGYDSTKGAKPSVVNGRLLFNNGALIPNIGDLDSGCTIQFEAETEELESLDNNISGYLVNWTTQAAATTYNTFRFVGTGVVESKRINAIVRAGTTDQTVAQATVEGKGAFTQVHLSFRRGYIDVYLDYEHHGRFANPTDIETNAFYDFYTHYRGAAGGGNFNGYMRNLQIVSRPVLLATSLDLGRIVICGDSISQHGNYENTSTLAFNGTDTGLAGVFEDAGCTMTVHRELAQDGIFSRVWNYAVSSTTIEDTGTNDVVDQVNGAGTFDALEFKPHWIAILGGTNDVINSTDGSEFANGAVYEVDYQAIIDQIKSRSPDSKILLCSTITLSNNPSYGTDENDWADLANTRLDELVSANNQCYKCDTFAAFGGHSAASSLFATTDHHLSLTGQLLLGQTIKASLIANR